ncbi:MAG TPA: hypothetical protein VJM51_03930, partial [Dehalococcoidia bacterium]|nr:hypothetical protein [Dehalococcoidia bacterium]
MSLRGFAFLAACAIALVAVMSLVLLQDQSSRAQPAAQETEAPLLWGDVDCSGGIDSVDALQILRSVALLPVVQNTPC